MVRPIIRSDAVDSHAQGTPSSVAPTAVIAEDNGATATAARHEATVMQPVPLTGVVKLKLFAATFCFFNAGLNDGSLGALVPYILAHYQISTGWIAILYGTTFTGWLVAAFGGGYSRISLGTGGVIIAGAVLQCVSGLLRFWMPPFGLFAVTFFTVALGQGLQEPQANTFVSSLESAHRWLGLVHSCYALGGLVGPLIAAAIASNFPARWAYFYYVTMGIGAFNFVISLYAFRDETTLYQKFTGCPTARLTPVGQRRSMAALVELKATFNQKPVWLLSLFFFLYLGAAITAGGWVVEFLAVVRGGELSQVGYVSSAFYGGLFVGRLVLAEPTFRYGEKRMLLAYGILSLILQIIFWQVPNIAVDAVMVGMMGFFLGPAFATAVSVGSQLIPPKLQSAGLAFIFVMAQAGGAVFPAVTGVISTSAGVRTLEPILVGLLAAMSIAWMTVPNPRNKRLT